MYKFGLIRIITFYKVPYKINILYMYVFSSFYLLYFFHFIVIANECICSRNLSIMLCRHASKLKVIIVYLAVTVNIQAFDVWLYWREKRGEIARVWRSGKREAASKGTYILVLLCLWCSFLSKNLCYQSMPFQPIYVLSTSMSPNFLTITFQHLSRNICRRSVRTVPCLS